jgi:hypothetical protein
VVEHLSSIHEDMGLITSTTKRKRRERERERKGNGGMKD